MLYFYAVASSFLRRKILLACALASRAEKNDAHAVPFAHRLIFL